MNSASLHPARLENVPISFFAMVMGLSGLTIAWGKAQHLMQADWGIYPWLAGLVSALFVVLAAAYTAKVVNYPGAVAKELGHPVKLNFFPTVSISLLLLSVVFMPLAVEVSRALWLTGCALHLLLTLYVINTWMHGVHFQVQHMNPAWFIPAVGNVLVPVAGVPLGYADVSWFFFSIGMIFWVILLTIIFYRVLFHDPIDERLLPTLFILIAPPAVGFIAYTRLTDGIDPFGRILYYGGLFLTLLLFTQARRFLRLPFFLSWWAYSFPLAAISIASMLMFEKTGTGVYAWIGGGLLLLLSLIVTLLLCRTAMAVKRGQICVPGH
ncbi:MAG: SLAC1 anion channel family protein [Gammaproteobacteria bacterium]|nr:SLAC1 anion channel family protein [Gammaproteobacteria bacterium]MBU1653735.1 SLAC1 anion channel family protein [Gammaproteobacteria bacterium]MBU1959612.1 SLAC1 anion channel family protein [Gammaproteobacteria bacterium]